MTPKAFGILKRQRCETLPFMFYINIMLLRGNALIVFSFNIRGVQGANDTPTAAGRPISEITIAWLKARTPHFH